MLRLLGAFLVLSVLLIGTAWGGGYGDAVRPASLTDTDNSPKVTVDKPGIPLQQGEVLDSPGIQVGTSYYDYQANGSTGNRVAVHDCGIHFAWMNGVGAWTGNRWIYYNYMDPDGNLGWPGGTQVSVVQGAGYTTIDNDAAGKALIAFHSGANMIVTLAEDDACGSGNFTLYDVPNAYTGYLDFYWPYLTYDYGGRVHVVSTENATGGQVIGHTFTDDYNNWPALQLGNNGIDINTVSVMTTSSLVDNKVAIVYMRGSAQTVNDVAYHESMDGITWNYADVNNITNYQQADSVRGYSDLDAVYDYNGNLHIIWGAQAYLVGPTNGALLMHWSEATGTDMIASGWWTSNCGVWNSTISKMSIGTDTDGNLYALWTQFTMDDVSAGGYSNGELYISYSTDGGDTWATPINVTNSPSPGCAAGQCDSDHWSSLAELVDENLHILYINDKDAGGVPQGEGSETENPVLYLEYPNPLAPLPDVSIFMYPDNPPIIVPQGGSFTFTGELVNNTNQAQVVDVGIFMNVPGIGFYGPLSTFFGIPLSANQTITVPGVVQSIPGFAPIGTYVYYSFCGIYPSTLISSDNFSFEVIGPPIGGNTGDWNLSGWFDEGQPEQPAGYLFSANYPNPFNAQTTISFSVPSACRVTLEVYNMLGQKMETLIDSYFGAGQHNTVWDASTYSSGVYFYKLTAGETTVTRRMTLVK